MIVVHIIGGLGNQMFQYAFGYAVAKETQQKLKLDIFSFASYSLRTYMLKYYGIDTSIATMEDIYKLKYINENLLQKIFRKLKRNSKPLAKTYYKESHFYFDENVFKIKDDCYFEGYWQSEKYFLKYREDLLREFTLKNELHHESKNYHNKIAQSETVSLHIRRGDYVTNLHINNFHGTCSLDYYKNAVKVIEKKVSQPHFFIFSDDLEWAKKNLDFIKNITFVELGDDVPDHDEMMLMSFCKHNIIANSSFSWWGAWLNQNTEKIVIAPKKWSAAENDDRIPKEWILL